MPNTVTWPSNVVRNADGLVTKYGLAETVKSPNGSSTSMLGGDIVLTWEIDYARLPAFSANEAVGQFYGGYPNQAIPVGAFIKSVRLTPTTAFAGATATLSLGLAQEDGTEIDNDGLIDAVAVASIDTIGEAFTTGGALVGNNNGAILATTGFLWVSVQTATFTAGHGKLEVIYFMPQTVT